MTRGSDSPFQFDWTTPAMYRIDEQYRRVLLLAIGHRADIYRRP